MILIFDSKRYEIAENLIQTDCYLKFYIDRLLSVSTGTLVNNFFERTVFGKLQKPFVFRGTTFYFQQVLAGLIFIVGQKGFSIIEDCAHELALAAHQAFYR